MVYVDNMILETCMGVPKVTVAAARSTFTNAIGATVQPWHITRTDVLQARVLLVLVLLTPEVRGQ